MKWKKSKTLMYSVGWTAEAASWIMAFLIVLGAVAWHDSMLQSTWDELFYWGGQFARGSLFLTQSSIQGREDPSTEPIQSYPIWLAIMRYEADLSIGLLAASVGLVLVNAVRQWRVRRVWREPGAVASAVAVVAMSLCLLEEASLALKQSRGLWGSPSNPFPNAWPHCELRISLAVLGAWVVMALMGRFRPRRAWADRVGIVVGSLWLVVLLYRMFASYFIPFGNSGY